MVGVYAIPVNQFLLIQYYDYVFIIFEVLMYTFLLILQSAGCSPLLVRYGAIEMTALIITVINILICSCYYDYYCYYYIYLQLLLLLLLLLYLFAAAIMIITVIIYLFAAALIITVIIILICSCS